METLTCSHSFFRKGHEVMTDIAAIDKTAHLAASCMDGKIYVLDLQHERIGNALSGHDKGVTMIKYSGNKGYLISGGLDHCVNLWNPHVERKIGSLQGHRHQLIGLEVIPDTPQVISADESGLIKVWDLRKFAPVRTFKRETYVKDHTLPRTLTRPMRSMCYMPSRQRIAIAHSSLFFVELQDSEETPSRVEASRSRDSSLLCEGAGQGSDMEERSKPLVVLLNQPSRSIVVLTPRELQMWAVDSGQLAHRERLSIRCDATCVSVVDDQHSCIVGAEDGTIARLMLPRGAVVLSKRLHSAEVAAVRWVSDSRKIVSSSFDGTVLISLSANLEVLHTLNHWHGIQGMSNNVVRPCGSDKQAEGAIARGPLLTLREVEHLQKLFNAADYAQTGKVTAHKANEILEIVFPAANTARKPCSTRAVFAGRETTTMASLMKKAQQRLKETRRLLVKKGNENGNGGADAVTIDVHSKLQHLLTASPYDGSICVWKLKCGTVAGTGVVARPQKDQDVAGSTHSELAKLRTALIGQVVYLDPFPYFVLVEEGHPCQLSIWSSKAISSLFPYGHQRIVSLRYGLFQPDCAKGGTHHGLRGDAAISAAAWIAGGTNCANFFCAGDDQGTVRSLPTHPENELSFVFPRF
jgi:WD40 repeat protein